MLSEIRKSDAQNRAEATVDAFRKDLGPFVVAAQKTRMPMIFTDAEPTHSVIFANDAFLEMTGYKRDEVLGKTFKSLLSAGIDPENISLVDDAFDGLGADDPEIHYKRKDGTEFWVTLFVGPVCDSDGNIVQQFVSLVDLTKHKNDTARFKILVDELNHRVKNTLSSVQSIVTQAFRGSSEHEVVKEAIESRILALSGSHDLLIGSNWEGSGLHDLVETALRPFEAVAGKAERFTIFGPDVHLSPNTTLSLAIALHELATNAAKYGAFSNHAGTVAVDWVFLTVTAGKRLLLRWRERDGPLVTTPTRKGFGSWVIERGLAHELGADVTLNYERHGVTCKIDIPVPADRDI